MGEKVDMKEVISLSNEVKSATKSLNSNLDRVISNINVIGQMDSFKGKTAKSAKKYFTDFHVTILKSFKKLVTELDSQLSSHIAIFHTEVDSSESAILESNYLQDHEDKILKQYNKIIQTAGDIKGTIGNISDISSITAPSTSDVTHNHSEVTKYIKKTDEKLVSFTSAGKKDHSQVESILNSLESIMKEVGKLDVENRFTTFYSGKASAAVLENKKLNSFAKMGTTAADGFFTSRAMFRAGKNAGLRTEVVIVNGKKFYRVLATREALAHLGIEIDQAAERTLKHILPKHQLAATLKYDNKMLGNSNGWSSIGEDILKKHAALEYWNDKAGLVEKAKTVGAATLKGAKSSLKDAVDLTAPFKNEGIKGAGKALGLLGTGFNAYSNYQDARSEGLNVKKAAARAGVDTAIDAAVGGAVQTGLTALGTALIPIPGVGTAVGVTAGIFVNGYLNRRSKDKYGRQKKDSVMDKIKGWFH